MRASSALTLANKVGYFPKTSSPGKRKAFTRAGTAQRREMYCCIITGPLNLINYEFMLPAKDCRRITSIIGTL